MKKVLLTIITLFSTINSFGQIIHQQEILEFYGQEWYNRMEHFNPGILQVMDLYVDHGFIVEDITDDKYLLFDPLDRVPLNNRPEESVTINDFLNDYYGGNFNPLKYQFYPGNSMQVFRLSGVNKVILIQSQGNLLNN